MTNRPTLFRTRRSLRLAALVVSCVAIGGAQAAWEVNDRNSQRILNQINDRVGSDRDGSVNTQLKRIYDTHQVGSSRDSGDLEPEPTSATEKLNHTSISSVDVGASDRCPSASSSQIAAQQRMLCEELVNTEKAKYLYSLRIFKRMEKRKERLDQLEQDRSNLQSHDSAKLESNTNQLLALMSLMQIDQQQHAAYMAAYDARIEYLNAAQAALSDKALNGSKQLSLATIGRAVTGGAALERALDLARSRRDPNWRTGRQ